MCDASRVLPARIVLLAEAVALAINDAPLPIPVQAQMRWMPLTDREDMSVIACWAVPSSEAPANLEAIGTALFQKRLPLDFEGDPQGEASYLSMRIDPILDPDHWNRLKQYTGVLRITYRVHA